MSNLETEGILLQNSLQSIEKHESQLTDLIIEYEGLLDMVRSHLSKYDVEKFTDTASHL